MNDDLLAFIRVFTYLLIVILCLGLIANKPRRFVYAGNLLMAGFLMLNAINYIIGAPNTFSFQVTITLFVAVWAATHLLDLLKKE